MHPNCPLLFFSLCDVTDLAPLVTDACYSKHERALVEYLDVFTVFCPSDTGDFTVNLVQLKGLRAACVPSRLFVMSVEKSRRSVINCISDLYRIPTGMVSSYCSRSRCKCVCVNLRMSDHFLQTVR